MTVVNVVPAVVALATGSTLTSGTFSAVPWRANGPAIVTQGANVVFPQSITVPVSTSGPSTPIDLVPGDGSWCWAVTITVGAHSVSRYVAVPQSGPVDWASLVDVDPSTFIPVTPDAVAGWTVAYDAAMSALAAAEAVGNTNDAIMTGIAANPSSTFAGQLKTSIAAQQQELDVRAFGTFTAGSTWQQNRDAMQAANDAATALGGAVVKLPPGTFQLKGVIQDSHVTFCGTGTVLSHPDGMSGHMIEARQFSTTGTTTAGSFDVIVASAANIEVGTVLAVTGARGMSNRQNTLLSAAIDATQTTGITLVSSYGFPLSGYMTVGSEIIQYTGITSNVLQGVTRARFGTTGAAHGTTGPTDAIGVSAHFIAQVVNVSGTTVTLDRSAPVTIVGSPVVFSIVDPGVYDLRFEGNRQDTAAVHYPVYWPTVGNGHGDGIYAHRAQSTIFLGLGATGNHFGTVTAEQCMLKVGVGAAFWMFQSCRNNTLENMSVLGSMFIGVYIDDRTTAASPFDGPGEDNYVGCLAIDIPVTVPMNLLTDHTIGVLVSAGNRNTIGVIHASGVRTGVVFETGGQAQTWNGAAQTCTGNAVVLFRGQNLYQPFVIGAPGNAVIDANYTAFLAYGDISGNPYIGHLVGPNGEDMVKFPGGTPAAPGIAFRDEAGLGFYRSSAGGIMQAMVTGLAIMRFTATDVRLENGKHLLAATDNVSDVGNKTNSRFRDIRAARYVVTGAMPTSSLTSAFIAGAGATVYDTTRNKMILSDGTSWINLDGSVLT